MASAQLTDEELFSELRRLGFSPGPVTEQTRPVYLKKLKKLREDTNEQHRGGLRQSKAQGKARSTASNSSSGGVSISISTSSGGAKTRARPDRKSTVLGFSSDESDAEATHKRKSVNHGARGKSSVNVKPLCPAVSGSISGVRSGVRSGERSGERSGDAIFVSPRSPPLSWDRSRASAATNNTTEVEKEDSGEEEDYEEPQEFTPRSVNGSRTLVKARPIGDYSDSEEEAAVAGNSSGSSRPGPRRVTVHKHGKPAEMVRLRGDETQPQVFVGPKRREPIGADLNKPLHDGSSGFQQRGAEEGANNHVGGGREDACGLYSYTNSGLRSRFSPYSSAPQSLRGNHLNHSGPHHSPHPGPHHSPQRSPQRSPGPEDELLQQFRQDPQTSRSATVSAHYLSMLLLCAAGLFFLTLGLVYVRMRGGAEGGASSETIRSHPFGPEFDDSYNKTDRDLILDLLLRLHDHLASVAGDFDCGNQNVSRSLSIEEATAYLQTQHEQFKGLLLVSLEWILRTGQDVGISLVGAESSEPLSDVSEIEQLESTHPRMPFTCRFRRAFFSVICKVLLLAAVVGGAWGVVCYVKFRWRREEEETRLMYDMVERIIDVLRSHSEACLENQELQPYLPIPHVRDSLVHPQDRKKLQKVWDRAVKFLSANESRIRTESQRIGGADFLVWRWIQPSLGDKSNMASSKVWQGKAFPLDRRNSPPNSLTPCLKIRNMFDPVMEVGENWDLAIHQAILEKCSDNNGIVHIAVDKNSREGCVYVKCLSAEHSGKAFKALHGSWFDGKLVTVKYLRLDRYHQRFPQAQSCCSPLHPNRLSSSAPYS